MTPPVEINEQKPVYTSNVKVGASASYNKLGNDAFVLFGTKAEGQLEYKEFFAGADVTFGSGVSVGAEVGKNFDIGNHFGVEVSADANYTKKLFGKNNKIYIYNYSQAGQIDKSVAEKWKPGITTAGLKVLGEFKPTKWFTLGMGVSGQYAKNDAKNLSLTTELETTEIVTTEIKRSKEGIYVSPELKAEWRPNEHISFNGEVNRFGGEVSFGYNF